MSIAPLFAKAQRHLARRDPMLKQIVKAVGPCTLRHDSDGFAALVRSIISQQISTKAAASIRARLEEALKPNGLTPRAVLRQTQEQLRSVGLSAAKARSVHDLAEKVTSGLVPLAKLSELADEEIIERLLPVIGIGRWTAEMFLIFSLGRLDVLPVTDLGLRSATQRIYHFSELPGTAALMEVAEPWRPYRSVATWYLWRSLGFVPQSGME